MNRNRPKIRARRPLSRVGAAVALAVLVAACGGSSTPRSGKGSPGRAAAHGTDLGTQGGSSSAAGASSSSASGQGPTGVSGGSGAGGATSGTTAGFGVTIAFARCMRSHGVASFPDPKGGGVQLAPGSGIDPGSPAYQSVLNGACRSLAPSAWVSSGPSTGGSGGGS